MKSLKGIRSRLANTCNMDKAILQHSRFARVGRLLIQLAVITRFIEPVLLVVATLMLMSGPALGQDFFGQNDQALGSGVREAIRWGRNLLFLIGVGVGIWGVVNYQTEKAYMRQFVGAGMSFGFGTIMAVIYSFSQGNAVDLDTDLGN
jgi:hypothetical protein